MGEFKRILLANKKSSEFVNEFLGSLNLDSDEDKTVCLDEEKTERKLTQKEKQLYDEKFSP